MIDCVTNVSNYLEEEWTETDPGTGDINWAKGSGFDPKIGFKYIQLLVDDLPDAKISYECIGPGTYRVTHEVIIRLFLRPDRYMSSDIDTARVKFFSMMREVDRLLNSGRYDISQVEHVELTSWKYNTNRSKEPVVFDAQQVIKCVYYIDESEYTQARFPYVFMS